MLVAGCVPVSSDVVHHARTQWGHRTGGEATRARAHRLSTVRSSSDPSTTASAPIDSPWSCRVVRWPAGQPISHAS